MELNKLYFLISSYYNINSFIILVIEKINKHYMDNSKNTQLFVSLIYTFQMQTFVSLGKLKNPMTEKTEKDLTAAQTTIDMIEMLKTGNTGDWGPEERAANRGWGATALANIPMRHYFKKESGHRGLWMPKEKLRKVVMDPGFQPFKNYKRRGGMWAQGDPEGDDIIHD